MVCIMDVEIPLNIGYTVLGGGLAAIFGFASQKRYVKMQRKHDIEKIQILLKEEFTDLYDELIRELERNSNAKEILKMRTLQVEEKDMAVLNFLSDTTIFHLTIRVWDTIVSSGNLIKLEHSQIKKIHILREKIKYHVKYVAQLETNMVKDLDIIVNGKTPHIIQNPHNVHIIELYLKQCGKAIEKSLYMFKDLDKKLFDYDKIKNFD